MVLLVFQIMFLEVLVVNGEANIALSKLPLDAIDLEVMGNHIQSQIPTGIYQRIMSVSLLLWEEPIRREL